MICFQKVSRGVCDLTAGHIFTKLEECGYFRNANDLFCTSHTEVTGHRMLKAVTDARASAFEPGYALLVEPSSWKLPNHSRQCCLLHPYCIIFLVLTRNYCCGLHQKSGQIRTTRLKIVYLKVVLLE